MMRFEKLANKEFPSGYVNCETQNFNESLHHLVWLIVLMIYAMETKLSLELATLICNPNI